MDDPSKFFFSLERKNCQSESIQCLQSEDGKDLTEVSDIRKRAVRFYKELYSPSFVDSYAKLVCPLTIEELFNVCRV